MNYSIPIPQNKTQIHKNLYKETQVFKCVHDVHHGFKSTMSPYHILYEKKCYPDGCVYFKWKCKLLAKKKKCFRKFEHVGRECFNCRYFYEEKIHQYPELIHPNKNEYFQNLETFEQWVQQLKRKRVRCEGTVANVRPYVTLVSEDKNFKRILRGFLIRFNSGYLDNHYFDDSFYLSVSTVTQNRLRFRPDDYVEFDATLILDRGRFKFVKCGHLTIFERGNNVPVDRSRMLVELSTSTLQEGQPSKCLECSHGILADIKQRVIGPRRAIICMAREKDYRFCSNYEQIITDNESEICAAMTCQHTL